jgi:hypothetical protein
MYVVVSRVALETAPARQVLRQAGVTKTDADRRISRDALKIQMLTDFRDQADAALARRLAWSCLRTPTCSAPDLQVA